MSKSNGNGNGASHGAKLEIAVHFGRVSIGDSTASIPIRVPRERLGVAIADEFLCHRRLGVSMRRGAPPDQPALPGLEDVFDELEGVTADTGNVSFSRKKIGCTLSFALDEIGTSEIGQFAEHDGFLKINSSEALPEKERKAKTFDSHEDVGPRPIDGQSTLPLDVDQGATLAIAELVKFGLTGNECETLAKAVGPTIAHLEKAMTKNEWWYRYVKGFGEKKIGKLQDAHLKFRLQFPVPTTEEIDRGERAEEAFRKGCESALAGETKNPFPENSPERAAWAKGFEETEGGDPGEDLDDDDDSDLDDYENGHAKDPAGASSRNRSRAKTEMTPAQKTAFETGEAAGKLGRDVHCPKSLPADEAKAWKKGYDAARRDGVAKL